MRSRKFLNYDSKQVGKVIRGQVNVSTENLRGFFLGEEKEVHVDESGGNLKIVYSGRKRGEKTDDFGDVTDRRKQKRSVNNYLRQSGNNMSPFDRTELFDHV